jgi:hypothetical protein
VINARAYPSVAPDGAPLGKAPCLSKAALQGINKLAFWSLRDDDDKQARAYFRKPQLSLIFVGKVRADPSRASLR